MAAHPWQNVPGFQGAGQAVGAFTANNLTALTQGGVHKPVIQVCLQGIAANANNARNLARRALLVRATANA